mgnify:FL=1
MCSSVDYWRCRWIKLGGALEYPQRGPSGPHPGPDLSTACPQGYPQGWKGGTRRCGSAHTPSCAPVSTSSSTPSARPVPRPSRAPEVRTPPRGDNWATRLPALVREVVGAGSSPSTGAHRECPHDTRSPRRSPPGRAARSKPLGGDPRRAGAARTTPHLRPIRTPAPTGALDGERHRGVIADRDRVGGGGSLPVQCGRARGRRCVRDRRSACSAAAADGPL